MKWAKSVKTLIASDHAGFDLKEKLKSNLAGEFTFEDLGPFDSSRVDYPDYADRVAEKVASGAYDHAILICGSGQGMAMRANRYRGVRAAIVWNEDSARLSREHNNANVICLGARMTPIGEAVQLVRLFFATAFEGGRHQARIVKLDNSVKS